MIENGIADYIAADTDISSADGMGTYEFTTGIPVPAVFTEKIPEDAKNISILVNQLAGIPWGYKAKRGTEALVDIEVHGDNIQSGKNLRNIAKLVWKRVHRGSPSVSGFQVVGCWSNYPARTTFKDEFPGFIIQARVIVVEE